MELKYLGTAAAEGWPAVFCSCEACVKARQLGGKNIRSRSQALIDGKLLIDYPPDAFMHSVRDGVDFAKIPYLLFTHCHEDHYYPDDLFMRGGGYSSMKNSEYMTVYGNDTLVKRFREDQDENSYAEVTKYTAVKELTEYSTEKVSEYEVTPLLADHNPREKCFFYLIEKEGKALLYAHDTGYFPDSAWEFLKGRKLDAVSLDCNHMLDPVRHNHMGLSCCSEVRERLLEMGVCGDQTIFILNHFSHNSRILHEEFAELAGEQGFLVSFDGMKIEI